MSAVPTPTVHALANGVRVVADPMPGLQSLALSVGVEGGARWETPQTGGWAHLLEHMVFKGAGPRDARQLVEAVEAEGGQINAATGYERTSFHIRALEGGLPLAMEVLADLIRRPTLAAADLEREKGVVAQEIAEANDTPDDQVFELAQAAAFQDQALGRPILGTEASLLPATRSALADFHRGLYAPHRLVVSAAGAVDEATLAALAEAAFGDMPAAAAPPSPGGAAFTAGAACEARKLEQAHLVLLAPGLPRLDEDRYALSVFVEILGGGMASRLFQEVREARGLAYAIDAYAEAYDDVGVVGVYAGTAARDAAPAAVLAAETLKGLASAPRDAELARARAQVRSALFMRRESPLARAEGNANQVMDRGHVRPPAEVAERVAAVGLDDLKRVGARLVEGVHAAGGPATAALGPKAAQGAGTAFAEALARG